MVADPETFAQRLKRLMTEKGLSQTELATRTEIDRSELNRIVHGKRSPKPREAAWLIEALGGSLEEFGDGLDVARDPAFKEEVVQHLGVAHRVMKAERERDEAIASRHSVEGSFRVEEAAWRDERKQLQEALRDVRKDCAERVKQRDEELARRENELLGDLSTARDRIAELERERREAAQLAADRLQQITTLTKAIDAERSKVASAGLFGGLVGALLGAGAGAAVVSSDDEDEVDEDEDEPPRRRRRKV